LVEVDDQYLVEVEGSQFLVEFEVSQFFIEVEGTSTSVKH
jgi:hypothetical protein